MVQTSRSTRPSQSCAAVDTENPANVIADRYTKGTGSSQAAAVVSGAVAVLLEARPGLSPDEIKSVLVATAQTNVKETFSLIDLEAALDEPVPADATQTWIRSTGTGTLDASRGTDHVTIDGEELVGQNTVFGSFDGDGWLAAEATGASWSGTSWSGGTWLGTSWSGTSWSGTSWSGSSWSGSSWS